LTDKGAKSAWLVPLMSVAGEHALKDMAGPQEDSWSSQLAKAGITPKPVLVGMAERAEIVAIWLDHLQMAYQRLDRE
jgi:sirohydrochlorin cobaltochelatase